MKRLLALTTLIIITFLSVPVCAALSSSVTASCKREFTFVYPSSWTISYGSLNNTEAVGMKNFFCYENEKLLLSLQIEELVHETGKGTLPVAIICERLTTGFSGDGSSQVILCISQEDWDNARPGNYSGRLIWVITSSLNNEVLGQYVTHISTTVPLPQPSDTNPQTGDANFNQLLISAALGLLFLLRLYRGMKMGKRQPNDI